MLRACNMHVPHATYMLLMYAGGVAEDVGKVFHSCFLDHLDDVILYIVEQLILGSKVSPPPPPPPPHIHHMHMCVHTHTHTHTTLVPDLKLFTLLRAYSM